jgi:hypothetical protein
VVVRIVLVAAVIAASLVFVQQKRVLQNAGLTGYCAGIATPSGQSGYWFECRPGSLTGAPELSRSSCVRASRLGEVERWRCPAPLER